MNLGYDMEDEVYLIDYYNRSHAIYLLNNKRAYDMNHNRQALERIASKSCSEYYLSLYSESSHFSRFSSPTIHRTLSIFRITLQRLGL